MGHGGGLQGRWRWRLGAALRWPSGPVRLPAEQNRRCRRRTGRCPPSSARRWAGSQALRVCPSLPAAYPTKRIGCCPFWGACASNRRFGPWIGLLNAPNLARSAGGGRRHEGATGRGQTLEEALDVGMTPMTVPGAWGTLVSMRCTGCVPRFWNRRFRSLAIRMVQVVVNGKVCAWWQPGALKRPCGPVATSRWMEVVGRAARLRRDVRSDR